MMLEGLSFGTLYSVLKDAFSIISKRRLKPFSLRIEEETVTFEEKLRSLRLDVVKIIAHEHRIGIRAGYIWLRKMYPGHKRIDNKIMEQEIGEEKVPFDAFIIELYDGRKKSVYFDTSCFFNKHKPLSFESDYVAQKIKDLYSQKI